MKMHYELLLYKIPLSMINRCFTQDRSLKIVCQMAFPNPAGIPFIYPQQSPS